jgi:PKHD-type hydroxylase
MIGVHRIEQGFSEAECETIVMLARAAEARDARLVGQARDHQIRRADLVWLDEVEGTGWVMDRIIDLVRQANRETFSFDINEFSESAQVARYGAERLGHFDWHSDIGDGPLARKRKLTMVVQLSDPADYEGGALEVMPSSAVISAPRGRLPLPQLPAAPRDSGHGRRTLFADHLGPWPGLPLAGAKILQSL